MRRSRRRVPLTWVAVSYQIVRSTGSKWRDVPSTTVQTDGTSLGTKHVLSDEQGLLFVNTERSAAGRLECAIVVAMKKIRINSSNIPFMFLRGNSTGRGSRIRSFKRFASRFLSYSITLGYAIRRSMNVLK